VLNIFRFITIFKDKCSTPRFKKHLNRYLEDPKALLIFSGLHSPPLLANRELINQQGILILDPCTAAGSITRYAAEKNWIFRLSIDDSKAGYVIFILSSCHPDAYEALDTNDFNMANYDVNNDIILPKNTKLK